jgi:AAA+ ATPase superfamily predicted ATPase
MKNNITNPFVTGGYVGPDYFCDRQNESEILLKAISSKRNMTLISLRRMGKTGLLKHVKYLLENMPKGSQKDKKPVAVIYMDLMPTMNGTEMLNTLSSAILHMKRDEKNFLEKVLSVLSTLRPKIGFDELTGQPTVELKVESQSDIQFGFEHLLRFISEIKQDLVFMIDEFQQISQYPERNMEHILRTIIQSYPTIPFIFSGSSKHMLEPMFTAAGRPFYQSAELMYLDKIQLPEYSKFITGKFETGGIKIDDEALSRILDWTRGHTFYVQHICNLLYETNSKVINHDLISQVFHRVLTAQEPLFASFRNLIPAQQYKLLQAIAIEDGITQPTAGTFIHAHKLNSASSVATSLKALSEKEMLVQTADKWVVYDVFFSRWLQYQYGNKKRE